VLPKRRLVERTPAWLPKSHRCVRAPEALACSIEPWIRLTVFALMLHRFHAN